MVEGTGRHEVATRHQQYLDVVGPGLGQGRPGSGRDLVIPVQQGTVHVQCNGLITTHITSKNVETGAAPSPPVSSAMTTYLTAGNADWAWQGP